jgi:hypothetical protein
MNRKIAKMIEEIQQRGGVVGISPTTPDELAEEFLREVLDCPDCRAEAEEIARRKKRPEH